MKTSNQLKNGIAKGIAAIAITFLISANALCQLAFIKPNAKDLNRSIYLSGKYDILNAISDSDEMIFSELNLIEEWMTNPFEINHTSTILPIVIPEIFIEEELEIENWMTAPKWIESYNEDIEIEKWMTSPMEWCR